MFINCPIVVEGLLSLQGPFLGKTVQWLKFISAPPSPSPPLPTDSIAQSIIVVKDLVNFCLKRWPFSWSWFILIIELILHFPVHYLIWQQPCEEGSHGHYFPKGISDSLWKNSHLLSTSRLPDPVPNALHTWLIIMSTLRGWQYYPCFTEEKVRCKQLAKGHGANYWQNQD